MHKWENLLGLFSADLLLGDTNLRYKSGNIHWYRVGLKNIHGMKQLDVHNLTEALRNEILDEL